MVVFGFSVDYVMGLFRLFEGYNLYSMGVSYFSAFVVRSLHNPKVILINSHICFRVLVIVLTAFLSKYIPCILTVQRFGFIWARGVTLTFINGECMVNIPH